MKAIILGSLTLVLYGCAALPSPTATLTEAAEPLTLEVMALHDAELKAGELLMRGANLRSLMERYGHEPDKLWAIMVLGDYTEEMNRLMAYRQSRYNETALDRM